jgi:hypothetical protein
MQNFAPAFIMLRVALDRDRPESEGSGRISGLQFDSSSPGAAASRSHGPMSTVFTVPTAGYGNSATESDLEAGSGRAQFDRDSEQLKEEKA